MLALAFCFYFPLHLPDPAPVQHFLTSVRLASQHQFPGKLWLLSVRRESVAQSLSPLPGLHVPHSGPLVPILLCRQMNSPRRSFHLHKLPSLIQWLYRALKTKKSPASQVRNAITFSTANCESGLWSRPGLLLHVCWDSAECASGWGDMINSHHLQG